MKSIIIKLLPDKIVRIISHNNHKKKLKEIYNFDQEKFKAGAFNLVSDKDKMNLRGKITLHYHSLEKGLSNIKFREGFGQGVIKELFESLEEYIKKGYELDDLRFQTGLNTLESYIEKHKLVNFDIKNIEDRYNKIKKFDQTSNKIGGIIEYNKSFLTRDTNLNFENFANTRKSIRDFSNERVDINKVNSAIQIASTTPSVCNRQPWQVYVIEKGEKLNQILQIQGGLNGYGNNIDKLLLVTTNNKYLKDFTERNQGYIDGGLFSMNLLYGLHSQGIAACALNANLTIVDEKKIRSMLDVATTENIIMFMAIGNYRDEFKNPISIRDDYRYFTKYFS